MMDERQPTEPTPIEDISTPPAEVRELYDDVAVVSRKTGARMVWSEDHTELRVNTALFPDQAHAQMATLRYVAGHIGLRQAIQADANALLQITRDYPEASEPILRWQGLARLRVNHSDLLRDQSITPQNQTLTQEFQWALDTFVLTGKYPDQLSGPVMQAVETIPQSNGRSLVDYIASGRYLKFDGQNFDTHLKPLINKLAVADRQTGKSQQFEYRPSQTKDVAGSEEPIQESDIIVSVTPFYGGYYREQVCRYDPATRQIVRESGTKQTWNIDDAPDEESVWQTKRAYEGSLQSGQETLIKLPYGTLPLASTLKPANALVFMRDDLGIVSLDPRMQGQTGAAGKFSFDFVLSETASNQLNTPPTERDSTPVGGNLDQETQTLLEDLSTQTWMSDVQKAREIVLYVRKKLRYPEDKAEIGQIDSLYLSAGSDLWTKIAETGIAHCYWANIFRDELCKRLGIASRIATGPYVGNKDPRFDFAIVEARGMDKHAWGEVWDPEKGVWTHKGMDATPKKAKDDSQDQDEQQQPLDGDFGESLIDQPQLSEEEIEKLYQELSEQAQSATPPTPEEMAARQFEQETGVSWRDWHNLETWIERVNKTPIPAQLSIQHHPSTMYDEWRELHDLLYKRREIPHEQYKGPVRQSEGEFLDDSVTAYIDLRSGDDDPLGYQISRQKTREQVEVSVFDDDFLLDVSGSMAGLPADEQRKMVLSSEYNIRNLNARLNHSQTKRWMRTPLSIKSRVGVFGDWTTTLQQSTGTITEKSLLALDGALKSHNQSSRGLHEALKQYREALDPETIQLIKQGKTAKVLTIVSDGDVEDQAGCVNEIRQIRELGIVIQGLGFGSNAQDIKVVCHDPADPDAAVVIDDVREATLVRHRLLMKHLSRL